MNGEKPFYLSKTLWFNALTITLVVATYFGYTPDTGLMQTVKNLLLAVGPIVNLLLRFVSKKELGLGAFKKN